jgi:hypothetical protein
MVFPLLKPLRGDYDLIMVTMQHFGYLILITRAVELDTRV